ncbi:hypothetical protein HDV00_011068 [Rhizophlyctis rosea]|nr:hypothetical protein HDV00_011068 [Rhizophlyctis rosea]
MSELLVSLVSTPRRQSYNSCDSASGSDSETAPTGGSLGNIVNATAPRSPKSILCSSPRNTVGRRPSSPSVKLSLDKPKIIQYSPDDVLLRLIVHGRPSERPERTQHFVAIFTRFPCPIPIDDTTKGSSDGWNSTDLTTGANMAVEEMKVLSSGALQGLVRIRKTGTGMRRKKIPIAYSLTGGASKQIAWATPAEGIPPVPGWNLYSFVIDTKPGSVFVDEMEGVAKHATMPYDVAVPIGADGVVKWRSDMEFAMVEKDKNSDVAVVAGLKWSITVHIAKVYAHPDASDRDIMGASLAAVRVKDPYVVRSDSNLNHTPAWEPWAVPPEVLADGELEPEGEDVVVSSPVASSPSIQLEASPAVPPPAQQPTSQSSGLTTPASSTAGTDPSGSPVPPERPPRFPSTGNFGDDLFSPSSLYSLYSGYGASSVLNSGIGSNLGSLGSGLSRDRDGTRARYRGYAGY